MKIEYSIKAIDSLEKIAVFLKSNSLSDLFIKNHLDTLKDSIENLLTTFPNAGIEQKTVGYSCRKIMVKDYGVLYRHTPERELIQVLIVYKSNQPTLK